MDEMIGYIFGSLKTSEDAVKNIRKVLENQATINRRFAIFALVAVAYATMVEIRNQEQNNKIEKLSREVKELKSAEGE